MPSKLSAREFADQTDLDHLEVIRRIHKGDIKAKKWGWNWVIPITEVEAVKARDWYKRVMARRQRNQTA